MSRTTYYITYGDKRNDVLYLYDTNDPANKFARLYQVNAALLADYVSASPAYTTWPTLTGYIALWSTIATPLAPPPQPLGTTGLLVALALGGTYVAGRVDAGAIAIARHDLWGDAGEVHQQTFGAVVSAGSFTALAVADNEIYRGDLGQGGVYDNVLGVWLGPEYALMKRTDAVLFAADGVVCRVLLRNASAAGVFVTRWETSTDPGVGNDALNWWELRLQFGPSGNPLGGGTHLATFDTDLDTGNAYTSRSIAAASFEESGLLDTAQLQIQVQAIIGMGAPTPIDILTSVYARNVLV